MTIWLFGPWLPWMRKQLAPGASRKASAIAGRRVVVRFEGVGE